MKTGKTIITTAIALAALVAACISENQNPFDPPARIQSSSLLVDTGFTAGSFGSPPGPTLGEYAAFTMHWTESEGAQFYEVRASEQPINPGNWYDAIVVAIVSAPADSAVVSVNVIIQSEPCIACGMCLGVCPMNAISIQGGSAVIDYESCTSCGFCMDNICPVDAVTGTRTGTDYFFGIRPFWGDNNPSTEIAVTEDSRRLIFYNGYYLFGPECLPNTCQLCPPQTDSLGSFGGCHIIEDYGDAGRTDFTGYGCTSDAIWQDTIPSGPVHNMVYIDYEKCTSCGVCFFECRGFGGVGSLMHRVVSSEWIPDQPLRP